MLYTAVTSVTFRQLSAKEIIGLAKDAGLDAIEWGGDIHVPPSDMQNASKIANLTCEAGLKVSSYGSYWRGDDIKSFEAVLATAIALSAPVIRVWAGQKGSREYDQNEYKLLAQNLAAAAQMAKAKNISVAAEYHCDTLTDTLESTLGLLADATGLQTYWQAPAGATLEHNLTAIQALKGRLSNIHVFSWEDNTRLPLANHEDIWLKYLAEISKISGDRHLIMEFVKNDDPKQFIEDAKALKEWCTSKKGWS